MKTPSQKRPPRKAKRWVPYPEGNWLDKIIGVTVLALTSPLWFPIWIVYLPFRLLCERKEKNENLAHEALRESTPPPPPPPPTDPELLRRRELARQTNKHTHPKIRHFYDPIRDDPDIGPIIKAAAERAHQEVSGGKYEHLGTCHLIWRRQKEILKEEHGITWYSPSEMNPRVIYD